MYTYACVHVNVYYILRGSNVVKKRSRIDSGLTIGGRGRRGGGVGSGESIDISTRHRIKPLSAVGFRHRVDGRASLSSVVGILLMC